MSLRAVLGAAVLLTGFVSPVVAFDQPTLEGYLPAGTYDDTVPRPADVLGFEVGEWHARPDQITAYLERLAESSDRARLEIQGHTWEGRPQPLLIVSSPANLERLDEIRAGHVAASDPWSSSGGGDDRPIVVWLAYSIHGNEASGANASMVVAYHLAASSDESVEAMLERTVVLIDPMLNPDGAGRFAHWANMHRGRVPVSDPSSREHNEPWPSGRTNHYWFDLNRDWLPAQHPESQNRLATFHDWRPNVLGDFHEMGSDATYFFQPGAPTRWHPLTPARTKELTMAIAQYHADALDAAGRLYYSRETFDDFYYGKGSTYPDLHGSVGILFEQASARGHLRETDNGPLSFPFAIQNHVTTSLSTLAGADAHRRDLLDHQETFAAETRQLAEASATGGWLCVAPDNPGRIEALVDLLSHHRVRVAWPSGPVSVGNASADPGASVLIPAEQSEHRLLGNLFERRTTFEDSTFYDVSAWTLPLAFGTPCEELSRARMDELEAAEAQPTSSVTSDGADTVAFALDWSDDRTPAAVYQLQQAGLRARVATAPFTTLVDGAESELIRGTVVFASGQQPVSPEEVEELVIEATTANGIAARRVGRGFAVEGIDLGSPSMPPIEMPVPAIVVGPGMSTYDAGAAWHLLDARYRIETTLLDIGDLDRADLERYTHLLFVDGNANRLEEKTVESLKRWVRNGGVIVASERSARWVEEAVLERTEPEEESEDVAPEPLDVGPVAYGDYDAKRAEELVSGAIFATEIDTTHPIAFGFSDPSLAVFRTSTRIAWEPENPFEVVGRYAAEPLLSGYASPRNRERIGGTPSILVSRFGEGTVIRFADDPAFRAFWRGTARLYLNGLFFGGVIERHTDPADWH